MHHSSLVQEHWFPFCMTSPSRCCHFTVTFSTFPSPDWTTPVLSACLHSHRRDPPAFTHLHGLLWNCSREINPDQSAPAHVGISRYHTRSRGAVILLAVLLWIQPRKWLVFWVVSTHCWVMLSFLFTNILKSFSRGLLSIHSPPSLYSCLGLLWPKRRNCT